MKLVCTRLLLVSAISTVPAWVHASPTEPQPDEIAEPEPRTPAAAESQASGVTTSDREAPDPTSVGDDANIVARAGLEVDTSAAGAAGPVILTRLEELGNLELRRAEILPRRHANDPIVRIRVEVRGDENDTYALISDVVVNGQPLAGSTREILCSLCTEGETVERARGEMVRLVPFIRAQFRPPPPTPPPTIETRPPPPRRGLGRLGKPGVGLLVGGGMALGIGIGLVASPPRPDPDNPLRQVSLRPAGFAMLGVGAAAIVTGAVLLILDQRQARRVAQLAPLAAPGLTGLQLVGRF